MTHRAMSLITAFAAFSTALILVPTNASAQDVAACFHDCQMYLEAQPAGNATPGMSAIIANCRADVPNCANVDLASMNLVGSWCASMMAMGSAPTTPRTPAGDADRVCFLTNGSRVDAEAGRLCECPAGTWPMDVRRRISADRLRSLGVPPGRPVVQCHNSMALQGTPGSPDVRIEALAATVAAHDEALRALCAANTSPALTAICTEARRQFLASGSQVGPVDLGPLFRAVENLAEAVRAQGVIVQRVVSDNVRQDVELEGHSAEIGVLSGRVDALTECIQRGAGHRITYTDSTGVTQTYTCPELLAANRRQVAETIRREGGVRAEEGGTSGAFILVQGFGLLDFSPLRYGNTNYGLPWSVGVELTLGIPLGGAWDIQVGGGLGGAFPDVPGVTNVMATPHIGFGIMTPISRDVHFEFVFGGHAALRFLPDGSLAHNVYAAFVEAFFRFNARSEWSPVLGFRLLAGVAPHWVAPGVYDVPFASGGMITLGFGHF